MNKLICSALLLLLGSGPLVADEPVPASSNSAPAESERAAREKAAEPAAAEPQAEEGATAEVLAGHSYHGEAFNEGPRQAAYLMGTTGQVHFPVTTSQPQVQEFINQGVGQLHGFWYFEAERSFRQAAALDPDCAMAYWGAAMANTNNEQRARGFIEQAVKRKDKASRREQLYIEALDAYLKADANKKKERAEQYTRALERILYEYPDDIEAKAFLALQLWLNRNSDLPITSHLAVDALLSEIFAVQANHPAHHYRIHLWDSERPEKALSSAALCGQSAPGIAHMWHMPGHIYSRLHRYEDAVWQQEASARVDHAHMMRDRVLPDQIHNFAHNNEWLIRNLNHLGQVHAALDLAKNMLELPRHPKYNTLKRGSSAYGRERLLETLVRFELWGELIHLAETPYLEPSSDEEQQVVRLGHLGVAYSQVGDLERSNETLGQLQQRLDQLAREEEQAVSEAEAKARQDGKNDPQVSEAREEARKRFESRRRQLTKYISRIEGYQALQRQDYATAVPKLRDGDADPIVLAKARFAAGETEPALEDARKHVGSRVHEVQPLAGLVELLWQAGQKEEAAKRLDELRTVAGTADLDNPVLARISAIARELSLPEDWRVPRPVATDVGDRPDLESLGPFRWQPVIAPEWVLHDAQGKPHALKEFEGRPVLVVFYLGYSCLHCAKQLQALAPMKEQFEQAGIALVAISTDDREGLEASLRSYGDEGFPFPLLSDHSLEVFKAYRAYDDFEQQPLHGTFLVDGLQQVRWQDISYEPFMDVNFLLDESKRLLQMGSVSVTASH